MGIVGAPEECPFAVLAFAGAEPDALFAGVVILGSEQPVPRVGEYHAEGLEDVRRFVALFGRGF